MDKQKSISEDIKQEKKKVSEAQKTAQKKYMEGMHTIHYRFPKEKKALIDQAAAAADLSLNAFVDRAVDHEIEAVVGPCFFDQD